MDSLFEQARTLFLEGVAHYQAGRLAPAEQKFAAALALVPARASVLTNLGAVRLKLGRTEEALAVLEEAIAREPGNAEALGHAATALAELGRTREALALFDRALAADDRPAAPWMLRGTALRELGQREEAAASFREALARGGDAELLGYYLASVELSEPPARPPRQYVETLFDGYADTFDRHLVQALHYEAPRVLVQRLAAPGRSWQHALDLGCGTGLAGPLLRPLAGRLTGIDLSAGMLEKASALGIYDALQQGDAVELLEASADRYDLVIAADVFIYVGALDGVFAALARRMPAGGSFCFTVEESAQQPLELRPTLRYAHSEGYVREQARRHGLRIVHAERRPVRQEQQESIAGLFVWTERT
jgi:predicted TPR repeat methyltransferase